jgi:hypothetical protein
MAVPRPAMKKEPEIKRGILVTTSYTPPRLSTIEWVEERRAVVLVTTQDGVDQTHMSEAARRRPKHAIIPWDGSVHMLEDWKDRIAYAYQLHQDYLNFIAEMDRDIERQHMTYLSKEEYDNSKPKKKGTA